MTEESIVIKKYKSFILGKCQCGHCDKDIRIRDDVRGILKKYYNTHRPTGSDSPFWKGGRWVNENGRKMLLKYQKDYLFLETCWNP